MSTAAVTMGATPADPTTATYIITTRGSSSFGIPYFRDDESDPRYSFCPTCRERVGPEAPKDFESFDSTEARRHWATHHATEAPALMDRFIDAGLAVRMVAYRRLVPTPQPRCLITFATAEDHEDVMRVLNDHPTVIAIEGEPPGVLSGLLQALAPLAAEQAGK